MDHVEQLAAAEGYETVRLTTLEDHPDLYRDRGSTKTETYPLRYREYDGVVMEKSIDEI